MKNIDSRIDKACVEYCEQVNSVYNEKDIFKAGANFALSKIPPIMIDIAVEKYKYQNRWRKVSEELPEDNENLILKKESKLTTQPVLIKTVGGGLFVDYRVKTIHENLDGWVEFWNWTRFNNNQVTEWMPISQID